MNFIQPLIIEPTDKMLPHFGQLNMIRSQNLQNDIKISLLSLQIHYLITLGRFQTMCPILGDLSPSLLPNLDEDLEEDLLDFCTLPSVAATMSDL